MIAHAAASLFWRGGGSWSQILDETGDGLVHPIQYPGDLATDAAGNLFVASRSTDTVFRVAPDGVVIEASGDGAGSTLDLPTGREALRPTSASP